MLALRLVGRWHSIISPGLTVASTSDAGGLDFQDGIYIGFDVLVVQRAWDVGDFASGVDDGRIVTQDEEVHVGEHERVAVTLKERRYCQHSVSRGLGVLFGHDPFKVVAPLDCFVAGELTGSVNLVVPHAEGAGVA